MDILNPYHRGASLFLKRLAWDLSTKSRASRKKIKSFHNKYTGKKAVILCNGPSLNDVDFDLLKESDVYTFGLNKINLLYNRTSFRADFIVSVNSYVIEQNAEFFNETDTPLFLDFKSVSKGIKNRQNVSFIHTANMRGEFAKDCSFSIYQGNTVTYVAMQLAYHMGFKEVTLVGCDHHFETKGTPNKLVESEEVDHNHFDKNYFAGGVPWQLPDLFESELAYSIAKNTYYTNGRKLYNSTNGGKLKLFPRINLQEFVK
jgi:hypothetical protein